MTKAIPVNFVKTYFLATYLFLNYNCSSWKGRCEEFYCNKSQPNKNKKQITAARTKLIFLIENLERTRP